MQNSKLSTEILPTVEEDWHIFINKIKEDTEDMTITSKSDLSRIRELESYINKIEGIRRLCKNNVAELLNKINSGFLLYIDNSLDKQFKSLEFFKEQDNLDNDVVVDIYNEIFNSPKIASLYKEYKELNSKTSRNKKIDDLINGNKYDSELIKELLNEYEFSDKEKKNILFYSVVMNSIRQKEEKKEKPKREKFDLLCEQYKDSKEEDKELLGRCYHIKSSIEPSEYDMYKGYINNPSEVSDYGFSDDKLLKIYVLALFKVQKDIDNYIDSVNDLQSEELDIDKDIDYFKELIDEYEDIKLKAYGLIKAKRQDDRTNVFFALNRFNILLIDKDILTDYKDSIEAFINNYDTKIDGIKVDEMHGVEEVEQALGKKVYMVSAPEYRLAYIMVNNCVLVLTGVYGNDSRFNQLLKIMVRENLIPIEKQIDMINKMDSSYIELEKNIIERALNNRIK